jgi:hypothetical protein
MHPQARARLISLGQRARGSWMLAPVLAGLAVLLQYVIDVPKGIILERESPTTVKDAADSDSSDSDDERPRKTKAKPKRSKAKKAKAQPPRTAEQLQQLRAEWSGRPFEEEPTDQRFRRQHEALLRSVATRARTEVLGERPPLPMQIRPTCRTIRCALELCGDRSLVDGVGEVLPRASVGDVALWHELREVEPTRKQPSRDATKDHICRRWIVGFAIENAEVGKVTIAEAKPPPEQP